VPSSDRGAKPKYCDDPDHNPLSAHRETAARDISATRDQAARQVADADARAEQAEQDAIRARQSEAAAIAGAEHAQAAAVDETARIRADHQRALDQLTAAASARIAALEETRDALRVRAERAETDLGRRPHRKPAPGGLRPVPAAPCG
jgi:hypothetical protein